MFLMSVDSLGSQGLLKGCDMRRNLNNHPFQSERLFSKTISIIDSLHLSNKVKRKKKNAALKQILAHTMQQSQNKVST